jgi:iron complex transport system substrate-binding protein
MRKSQRAGRLAAAAILLGALSAFARAQAPVTVKDNLGRTVTIPGRVRRVLSLQPEVTRLVVALGAGDSLVGIDHFLRRQDHLFPIIYPRQDRLPVVSMADYNVDMEVLAKLRPDVVFGAPEDPNVIDALQRKTRVPTVALSSLGRFDRLLEELRLVGRVLGRERRAEELAALFAGRLDVVRKAVAGAKDARKPRVYLSFWGGLTKTPVFYEPVATAGGINSAEGILPSFAGTLIAVVDPERIVRWDPDLILIQGNYPPGQRSVTVESVLADPRLASLKAVRAKDVRYTYGFWNWWDPAEVLVETIYLAKLFHPALFPEVDLAREGEAIFKAFYGIEGGFAALDRIIGCAEWDRGR